MFSCPVEETGAATQQLGVARTKGVMQIKKVQEQVNLPKQTCE